MKQLMLMVACLAAMPAFAQEADTAAAAPAPEPVVQTAPAPLHRVGGDTQAWLTLQKDPAAQVAEIRPVPGEVAEQVYQRYVNSFKFPIPEEFKRDKFVKSGSGS